MARPGGLELPTFWFVAGFRRLLPCFTQIHKVILAFYFQSLILTMTFTGLPLDCCILTNRVAPG